MEKLSSEVILNDARLKVIKDEVQLPNGKNSTYVRLAPTTNHSVIVIAIDPRKRILLQKEYSYPPNKVMWQLPGGSMKNKESVETAALRELSEESGYSAKSTKILGYFYTHNRLSDQKQYIVQCTDLFNRKLPEDEDELIENYWVTKNQLVHKITSNEFHNINLLAALNIWFINR